MSSKKSRRQERYGKLVRGWDWRTTPDLLQKVEEYAKSKNITKTELIENAILSYIFEDNTSDVTGKGCCNITEFYKYNQFICNRKE